MQKKIKCPVCLGKDRNCVACGGTGKIQPPKPKNYKKDEGGKFSEAAKRLSDCGYTLREIAEILGYKHPQSIQSLLSKQK